MSNPKSKILHTRLPEELFDHVVGKAKKHRTTVSHLMRNLVEDFLEISGDVTDLMADKARKTFFGKSSAALVGYQSLTLTRETECEDCGAKIASQHKAYSAVFQNSRRGVIICQTCLTRHKTRR
jgi:hypothetical protein